MYYSHNNSVPQCVEVTQISLLIVYTKLTICVLMTLEPLTYLFYSSSSQERSSWTSRLS